MMPTQGVGSGGGLSSGEQQLCAPLLVSGLTCPLADKTQRLEVLAFPKAAQVQPLFSLPPGLGWLHV